MCALQPVTYPAKQIPCALTRTAASRPDREISECCSANQRDPHLRQQTPANFVNRQCAARVRESERHKPRKSSRDRAAPFHLRSQSVSARCKTSPVFPELNNVQGKAKPA